MEWTARFQASLNPSFRASSRCHCSTFWNTPLPPVSITSPWHGMMRSKSHLLILAVDAAKLFLSLALVPHQIILCCASALPWVLVKAPKILVKKPELGSTPVFENCSVGGLLNM